MSPKTGSTAGGILLPEAVVLSGEIRIGTSGYSFKDWVGPIYPERLPQKE